MVNSDFAMDDYASLRPETKALVVSVIIAALIICSLQFYLHRKFINDDTYISLRYAYNIVNGDGPVWNPGERVEGYTNFLHIIFISLLGIAGVDLLAAARVVNVAAFVLLNFIVLRYLMRLPPGRYGRREILLILIPSILILNTSPLISWIYGGLEGPLFTLFCTGGLLYFSEAIGNGYSRRSLAASSLFFALATLTRPDGFLFFAAAYIFIVAASFGKQNHGIRSIAALTIPFLAVCLPYFLWRFTYYGELLPLSFHVKATAFTLHKATAGVKYIFDYLKAPPFIFAILLVTIPYSIYKRTFDKRMGYILVSVVIYLAFIIYIGGDYMYSFRMILPLIPSSMILAYLAIRPHIKAIRTGIIRPAYAIVFALIILQWFRPGTDVRPMSSKDYEGKAVGLYITRSWPKGSLVALNTAGATPYYAPDYRYIDMLGLNDVHIAKRKIDEKRTGGQTFAGHFKGDGAYVLSREPDYIIIGPAKGTLIDYPWFLSDLEMKEDPRFYENYEMRIVPFGSFYFTYYQRLKQKNGAG